MVNLIKDFFKTKETKIDKSEREKELDRLRGKAEFYKQEGFWE